MHRIKPYYKYIQTELVEYIKTAPDQWQAKVLALLSFNVIYSFEEIIAKTDLSPVYVLKALIISEKMDITIYSNGGWVLNKKLDSDDLNDYLELDIADCSTDNDRRMKRLVDGLPIYEKVRQLAKEPILTEEEKGQAVDSVLAIAKSHDHKNSYIDTINDNDYERPVDGSGRKKSKEWNTGASLDFGRAIREAIRRKNKEKELSDEAKITTKKPRLHASPDLVKSEKLYAKLCSHYPEYEKYITRHHEKDPSFEMMRRIAKKIDTDFWDEIMQQAQKSQSA